MPSPENPSPPDLSALRIDPKVRTGRSRRRRTLWTLGVLVALSGLTALWASSSSKSVTVEVAVARSPRNGEAYAVLNASGYVTPRRRATVAAKITGRVVEMLVEEGMKVKEGQVLARLDDSDARVRLVSAQAERQVALASISELGVNLADAERTLERIQKLERPGFVSVQELDKSRTSVDSLRARLHTAREQVRAAEARMTITKQDLDNCTVRAPFDGVAVSKDAQVGEMVSPISAGGGFTRTGIATIVDMDSLEIEVDVNESYIAKVVPGQRVEAILDAYPDWRIPAKVRTVIPTADRQKATVKVRISFDSLDPRILPDMGVKVSFLREDDADPGAGVRALIAKDAVREASGAQVVFVMRQGRLERRVVQLGQTRIGDVEVLSGLSEGEHVVVRGPETLQDGQRAQVK